MTDEWPATLAEAMRDPVFAREYRRATCQVCGGRGKVAERRGTWLGVALRARPCPGCREGATA